MNDSFSLGSAAYDAQALNQLKRHTAAGSDKAIRETAKQMEGMFVQMMLKSMRAALPQDGELSTEQTKLYTSMYDQQIAQDMSGSLGIADMLVQQLSGNKTSIPDSVGTTPMALDGETIQSMPVRALEQVMRRAMPRIPQNGSPMPTSNGASLSLN